MTTRFEQDIALPADYRRQDVLDFHGRDRERLAEQVGPAQLRKGIMLDGRALQLEVQFSENAAHCVALADGALLAQHEPAISQALLGMLGLRIDPAPFSAMASSDPLMGRLTKARPGLRIVQSASVFEALTWAVIGQQINLTFAIALRRSFIEQAGRRHSGGLWCYPEAADAARLDVEALTSRKFSRAKAETVLRLARLVDKGLLDLTAPADGDIGALSAALLAVKGIGPWTVHYALLRGYAYADCSLHGDVAIRAALQQLLGAPERPDMVRTQQWLEQYRPQRTMAAAYLWDSLKVESLTTTSHEHTRPSAET